MYFVFYVETFGVLTSIIDMNFIKLISHLTVICLFLFVWVNGVMAQVNIGEAFKLGEDDTRGIAEHEYQTVGDFINGMLPNVMIVANIILFFLVLFGGFMMITNAGNPEKQAQGAQVLTGSLIGFLIIFGAYWLMQIFGETLGIDIFNSGQARGATTTPVIAQQDPVITPRPTPRATPIVTPSPTTVPVVDDLPVANPEALANLAETSAQDALFRDSILTQAGFSQSAAQHIVETSSFNLNTDGSGGGWSDQIRNVTVSNQSEAAVHELSHVWWHDKRVNDPELKNDFVNAFIEMSKMDPVQFPEYAGAIDLAKIYVNGDGSWEGMFPGVSDVNNLTTSDYNDYGKIIDWEIFAGGASASMGNLDYFPPNVRKYYAELFTGDSTLDPTHVVN